MMDIAAMEEIHRGRAQVITLDPGFMREIRDAGRAWAARAAAAATAAGNPWTARAAEQIFRMQDRWEAGSVYRL
jgi:DNA-binding GntR family transcriptional regulator